MSDQHRGRRNARSGDSGHEVGGKGADQSGMHHGMRGMYLRFGAMIATSIMGGAMGVLMMACRRRRTL